MSIRISNLSKFFAKQQVLKDINIDIAQGEIVGFLGPNGAGKTTTMRILMGVLSYQLGSVEVCGLEVSKNRRAISSMIGYLPENNPLYMDMYVRESLDFVAQSYGIKKDRKQRVEQMVELVGLQKEAHKKIHQLSKGYRQRVGLAQALIHNPQVLILDEPTTGLDPNQLVEIRELIKASGENKTVLLSTHIMQEVEALCSRAIIINHGEIVGDIEIGGESDALSNYGSIEEFFRSLTGSQQISISSK